MYKFLFILLYSLCFGSTMTQAQRWTWSVTAEASLDKPIDAHGFSPVTTSLDGAVVSVARQLVRWEKMQATGLAKPPCFWLTEDGLTATLL